MPVMGGPPLWESVTVSLGGSTKQADSSGLLDGTDEAVGEPKFLENRIRCKKL